MADAPGAMSRQPPVAWRAKDILGCVGMVSGVGWHAQAGEHAKWRNYTHRAGLGMAPGILMADS
jgi:hypothetical protein